MGHDFSQRSTQAELLDFDCNSFAELNNCMRELETINHLTLAYRPTLNWIRRLIKRRPKTSAAGVTILDVGSGGGDMLRMIRAKCSQPGLSLIGADLNPLAAQVARGIGAADGIRYETANIFDFAADETFDLIISSLFAHHLNDRELIRFIRWMDAHATGGWFINDLHRHWLPYYFIKLAAMLFSRDRFIRHDAPLSVKRAFSRKDLARLIAESGIDAGQVRIRWFFPFRFGVSCQKA